MEEKILVGFGRADITPTESVPLRGYGNTSMRMSQEVSDPQYATCIAFTDSRGETALLYAVDMTGLCRIGDTLIRPAVAEATGIPEDHIHASCSHNHSAADVDNEHIPSILRYQELLKNWFIQAAKDALADRKPADMFITDTQTQGLNFVRRYVMNDGTYCGDNYGDTSSGYKCHESEADRQLQLIKIVREGCKDIILANFQGHPHRRGGSKKYNITSDVVGAIRDQLESRLDCQFAYFTGGSGNQNSSSRIKTEMAAATWEDHGRILADYAVEAAKNFRPVSGNQVRCCSKTLECPLNHSQDHLVDIAREIQKVWATTGDGAACREMGKPYGINSPYHAGAIVSKAAAGSTITISIHVVAVGNLAFAVVPYEMFDTNGKQVKEGSPFDMTFVCTCANSGKGYIPSELGYAHGGYSVDTTRFAPGSGELLAREYVAICEELHK